MYENTTLYTLLLVFKIVKSLQCVLKEYNRLFFLIHFLQHILMESLSLEEENIIKDI